jgi:choice-of-anchor B domain-containing protein
MRFPFRGWILLCALALGGPALRAQVNTSLLGQLSYSPNLNDIWGYAAGGKEYALVGTTSGTSIVDVTNPAAPVEVVNVNGVNSIWRDLKTWGSYAYAVNEGGGGLQVINLANLPSSAPATTWTGGPLPGGGSLSFSTAHNLFIDENGIGYIIGANFGAGGAIMVDLAANPTNPPIVGVYNANYCHDLFVRNDVMYTAEIYTGRFAIVDVSNKANPVVLATQSTPNNFTHNVWLSDDGNTLYTTDETNGAGVAAYDISDPTDITFLDIVYSSLSGAVPHNTFVVGDFLVTSQYKDGVTIVDASNPANLVQTGSYDTSPLSGGGFDGCWGVYPYLPSGIVLASDQQQGLFVIDVTYAGAATLSGTVTDAGTGAPIFGASVAASGVGSTSTNLFGQYSLAVPGPGSYSVTVAAAGYDPQTVPVTVSGSTTLDVALNPGSGGGACPGYCVPSGNTVDEWISSVSIGGLINNSGDNGGYADFGSAFGGSYPAGGSVAVSLTPGYAGVAYDEYWRIWIDANRDGDFNDAGELVFDAGSATNATVSGTMTIPAGAATGFTGMRVQMKFFGAGNPCENLSYGEVEDYCIEITGGGGGTCSAPTNPTVLSLSATSATVGWDAVPGALGYQAQGRKGASGAFRVRNTSTNSTTVPVKPSTNYQWQVRVQCADGSISPYTALQAFSTPALRPERPSAKAWPNPSAGAFRVAGLPDGAAWRLIDGSGRVLAAGTANGTLDLDLGGRPAGLYQLAWTDAGGGGRLPLQVAR